MGAGGRREERMNTEKVGKHRREKHTDKERVVEDRRDQWIDRREEQMDDDSDERQRKRAPRSLRDMSKEHRNRRDGEGKERRRPPGNMTRR